MGKIMRNGKKYSGASSSMAENIVYDNTESGLEANDVQGAVDELSSNVDEQNKNFNMRYNSETDMIQCLFNGEWFDVMIARLQNYLFKNTDFDTYAYRASSDSSALNNLVSPTISNVSTDGEAFTLTGTSKANSNSFGCIFTKEKFLLTNKNKIIIVCTRNSTGDVFFKTTQSILNGYTETKSFKLSSGTNEIDISDLEGEHYVGISYVMPGSGAAAPTLDVTSFELL